MRTLTVIIPVFNEEGTILKIVKKVKAVDIDKEIIIVDDASTDGTPDLLRTIADDPDVRIISHEANKGRGAALKTGLAHASGFITIFQDADLELDPVNFPRLVQPILDGEEEVVFGSRFLGKGFIQGMGFFAYLGNVILVEMTDRLFKANLTDVLTMFQVSKTEIFRKLDIQSDRWGSTIEITAKFLKNGYRIYEVPVEYIPRRKETGKKVHWSDFFSCFSALIRYRFFYRKPERK
jgi:glycosyltransferase involved in cell wall biosynthesis